MQESAVFVAIGNGICADGNAGKINEAIVEKVFKSPFLAASLRAPIIFIGGFKNNARMTEAEAMNSYASMRFPIVSGWHRRDIEVVSYRTHNNAIEAMKLVAETLKDRGTMYICDHPRHLPRTMLCFKVVNRLYYRSQHYMLVPMPSSEVWDAQIYRQPYWTSLDLWNLRENKMMLLYQIVLFRPWARIGFWLLRTLWPSDKQ